MNQSFDARRWWLLVGKHWSENSRKYGLSLLALAGLLFLFCALILLGDHRTIVEELQMNTYFTGLFVCGCLYGSMLFTDLGSRTRGLNYLVVPASSLEKLLCAIFYGVVAFFICYTAIFYIVDMIMVKVGNALVLSRWLSDHPDASGFRPAKVFNLMQGDGTHKGGGQVMFYILLGYFVLQSAFIAGSIYFSRFSFVKTVIALFVVGLVIGFIVVKLITPILPPGTNFNSIVNYHVYTVQHASNGKDIMIYSNPGTDKLVSLPSWINDILMFLLKYAFAPLFWLAAYYRLKEKEI